MPAEPFLSAFLALSLDGRIAGPGHDLSWLERYQQGEDTGFAERLAAVDTLLLGRNTYDAVLGFGPEAWPYTSHRVRVLTHRPLSPRHGEAACSGDIGEILRALGAEGARHVYIDGGDVVRQCLRIGRLDELVLFFAPSIVGDGPRLFEGTLPAGAWTLLDSRAYPSGLLKAVYRPLRAGIPT